jgi:putative membrane protein
MKPSIYASGAAIAIALAFSMPVYAQDARPSGKALPQAEAKVEKDDLEFMETLARDNLAEIERGKLADSKASDERVKELAAMMVKDRRKANQELLKIAKSKGVDLPTSPSREQQGTLKELQEKIGPAFDKAFVQEALEDSEKARKLLDRTSKGAKDGDVRKFAQATLPVITAHLKMAREISGKKSTTDASRATGARGGDLPR